MQETRNRHDDPSLLDAKRAATRQELLHPVEKVEGLSVEKMEGLSVETPSGARAGLPGHAESAAAHEGLGLAGAAPALAQTGRGTPARIRRGPRGRTHPGAVGHAFAHEAGWRGRLSFVGVLRQSPRLVATRRQRGALLAACPCLFETAGVFSCSSPSPVSWRVELALTPLATGAFGTDRPWWSTSAQLTPVYDFVSFSRVPNRIRNFVQTDTHHGLFAKRYAGSYYTPSTFVPLLGGP